MRMISDCGPNEIGIAAVELIHQIPGRSRFRVPALRRDGRMAFFLQRELLGCTGIRQVAVSTLTATVLVQVAPGRSAESIADVIRELMAQGTPEILAQYAPPDGQTHGWVEKTLQPWHTLSGDDVVRHFDSSEHTGLSSAVVIERRSFFGDNRLPGTASRSLPAIWKSQVTSLPVVLTGVAALLAVLTGGVVEGVLALTIALLNAAIGAFQRKPLRTHPRCGPRIRRFKSWGVPQRPARGRFLR